MMPNHRLTFLEDDATVAQLLRAIVVNHRQFMIHGARRAGGTVLRENGVLCANTPGADGGVEILFPYLSRATASETLDRIVQYCRDRRPLRSVSCWSLLPSRPPDLGARLVARGFEWGWQPHWMWLDFRTMQVEHPQPPGLRIALAEEDPTWDVEELPNYDREAADRCRDASGGRRRLWHFGAWLDGRVVGHCSVFVTTGRLGVAGIYNCGVVPSARNQGIGKAVTLAACRQGQMLGCRCALLNATPMGERIYRRLGFESIGYGQTWWLHRRTIEAAPPSATEVAFAEAVGRAGGLARSGGRITALAISCSMVSAILALVSAEGAEAWWGEPETDGFDGFETLGAGRLMNHALSNASSRGSSVMPALVIR